MAKMLVYVSLQYGELAKNCTGVICSHFLAISIKHTSFFFLFKITVNLFLHDLKLYSVHVEEAIYVIFYR